MISTGFPNFGNSLENLNIFCIPPLPSLTIQRHNTAMSVHFFYLNDIDKTFRTDLKVTGSSKVTNTAC